MATLRCEEIMAARAGELVARAAEPARRFIRVGIGLRLQPFAL